MRADAATHRFPAAALLVAVTVFALAACGSGPAADSPAGVVRAALDKVAAKDLEGLRTLACAGEEDRIREQVGLPTGLGDAILPGIDAAALVDAVQLDVSKVKIGDATDSGTVSVVPLTGDVGVTFDAVKMRPILKQLLASQGRTMTDEQADALLKGLAGFGQSVPLDQSIRLVRENGDRNGAWRICQGDVTPPAS